MSNPRSFSSNSAGAESFSYQGNNQEDDRVSQHDGTEPTLSRPYRKDNDLIFGASCRSLGEATELDLICSASAVGSREVFAAAIKAGF